MNVQSPHPLRRTSPKVRPNSNHVKTAKILRRRTRCRTRQRHSAKVKGPFQAPCARGAARGAGSCGLGSSGAEAPVTRGGWLDLTQLSQQRPPDEQDGGQKWLLLRRRGRWRRGVGVRVRGGRVLGLQVVTYACIHVCDWADSEKRHRGHLGELRFRSKTKAGPLEDKQLSRLGNIALVR